MSKGKNQILNFEPFNKVSDENIAILTEKVKLISFDIGEQLIDENIIPGRVLVVSSGSARSLIREKGKLKNFRKYETGAIIGAASIMTGHPCENYTAGDGLQAFSIEEELWSNLYENDENFRKWCDSNLWIEEVAYLISKKVENHPIEIENSYKLIDEFYQESNLIKPTQNNLSNEIKKGNYVFNLSYINEKFDFTKPVLIIDNNSSKINYSTRLISIPTKLIDFNFNLKLKEEKTLNVSNEVNDENESTKNDTFSPRSINNPGSDITSEIPLISGDGEIEEIIACLKMLTKYLKVPLRQDTVLKTLNSLKKQRVKISINEFAQVLSNLGFQVIKTRINSKDATRLKIPTIIPWKDSFAIVSQSNKNGITLI